MSLVTRLPATVPRLPEDVVRAWIQGEERWAHVLDEVSIFHGRRVTEDEVNEMVAREMNCFEKEFEKGRKIRGYDIDSDVAPCRVCRL